MGNEPLPAAERFWYLMDCQQILNDGLPARILVGHDKAQKWYVAQCELLDACQELLEVCIKYDDYLLPPDLDQAIATIARLLTWEAFRD